MIMNYMLVQTEAKKKLMIIYGNSCLLYLQDNYCEQWKPSSSA